jgi:competence protein ComFC
MLRWMPLQKWLSAALDLLYPGRCLLCGEELRFELPPFCPVCAGCLRSLHPLGTDRRCRVCSLPLISEQETCIRCRGRSYSFRRNLSLFEYRGAVRELLYQFKFRNRVRLGSVLAAFFAQTLPGPRSDILLVPVPANPVSVRARGWDPMYVIAGELARSHGFPVRRLLSRRVGAAQKTLSYEERRSNLEGKLRLAPRALVGAGRVTLLDDVFTTGATASECARVLTEAGVRSVDVLTLAIDVP